MILLMNLCRLLSSAMDKIVLFKYDYILHIHFIFSAYSCSFKPVAIFITSFLVSLCGFDFSPLSTLKIFDSTLIVVYKGSMSFLNLALFGIWIPFFGCIY